MLSHPYPTTFHFCTQELPSQFHSGQSPIETLQSCPQPPLVHPSVLSHPQLLKKSADLTAPPHVAFPWPYILQICFKFKHLLPSVFYSITVSLRLPFKSILTAVSFSSSPWESEVFHLPSHLFPFPHITAAETTLSVLLMHS
jgi:hypothetical protein